MLRDAGATWVILGHSERRQAHGETDALVRRKAAAAAAAGLTPIVCVGETEAQREAGQARTVVGAQVAGSLPPGFNGVIAYEPVWAIGTGRVPTEGDVAAMHAGISGGSWWPIWGKAGRRCASCMAARSSPATPQPCSALPEVGGALVGGASLQAEDFLGIAHAAAMA